MSQVQEFLQAVQNDPALAGQLSQATSREAAIQLAVELGKKSGYNFTVQEAEAAFKSTEELDEDQLDAVAGGTDFGTLVKSGK